MKTQHENGKKRWYALYTRPRWEKKVDRLLKEQGVETYCPLNKVRRKWSDRVKLVEEPLFKSYVFVKIAESDKTPVRMTSGVVNFVYWNGKPGLVKEREIEQIRRFLNEYMNCDIEVIPDQLQAGQLVQIRGGILMDREARIVEVKKNYVTVHIPSLGYHLLARLQTNKVTPVKNSR